MEVSLALKTAKTPSIPAAPQPVGSAKSQGLRQDVVSLYTNAQETFDFRVTWTVENAIGMKDGKPVRRVETPQAKAWMQQDAWRKNGFWSCDDKAWKDGVIASSGSGASRKSAVADTSQPPVALWTTAPRNIDLSTTSEIDAHAGIMRDNVIREVSLPLNTCSQQSTIYKTHGFWYCGQATWDKTYKAIVGGRTPQPTATAEPMVAESPIPADGMVQARTYAQPTATPVTASSSSIDLSNVAPIVIGKMNYLRRIVQSDKELYGALKTGDVRVDARALVNGSDSGSSSSSSSKSVPSSNTVTHHSSVDTKPAAKPVPPTAKPVAPASSSSNDVITYTPRQAAFLRFRLDNGTFKGCVNYYLASQGETAVRPNEHHAERAELHKKGFIATYATEYDELTALGHKILRHHEQKIGHKAGMKA